MDNAPIIDLAQAIADELGALELGDDVSVERVWSPRLAQLEESGGIVVQVIPSTPVTKPYTRTSGPSLNTYTILIGVFKRANTEAGELASADACVNVAWEISRWATKQTITIDSVPVSMTELRFIAALDPDLLKDERICGSAVEVTMQEARR